METSNTDDKQNNIRCIISVASSCDTKSYTAESLEIDETKNEIDKQFDNFGALVNLTQNSFLLETAKLSSMFKDQEDDDECTNAEENKVARFDHNAIMTGENMTDENISMLTMSPRTDTFDTVGEKIKFPSSRKNIFTPRRSSRLNKSNEILLPDIENDDEFYKPINHTKITSPDSFKLSDELINFQNKEIPSEISFDTHNVNENINDSGRLDIPSNTTASMIHSTELRTSFEKLGMLEKKLNSSTISENGYNNNNNVDESIDQDIFLPNNDSRTRRPKFQKRSKSMSVAKRQSFVPQIHHEKRSVGRKPPLASAQISKVDKQDSKVSAKREKRTLSRNGRKSEMNTGSKLIYTTKPEKQLSSRSKSCPTIRKTDVQGDDVKIIPKPRAKQSSSTSRKDLSGTSSFVNVEESLGPNNVIVIATDTDQSKYEHTPKLHTKPKQDSHEETLAKVKQPEERAREREEYRQKVKRAKEAKQRKEEGPPPPESKDHLLEEQVTKKSPEERALERAKHFRKIKSAKNKSVLDAKREKDIFEPKDDSCHKVQAKVKTPEERARERAERIEKINRAIEEKRQRGKITPSDFNRPLSRPSSRSRASDYFGRNAPPTSRSAASCMAISQKPSNNVNDVSQKGARKENLSGRPTSRSRASCIPLGQHLSNDDKSKTRPLSRSRASYVPFTNHSSKNTESKDQSTTSARVPVLPLNLTVPTTPKLSTLSRLGERRYSSRGRHGRNPENESNPISLAYGSPTHGLTSTSQTVSPYDAHSPSRQRSARTPLNLTVPLSPRLATFSRLGEKTYSLNRKNKVPDKSDSTVNTSSAQEPNHRSTSNPRSPIQSSAQEPNYRSASNPRNPIQSKAQEPNYRSVSNPRGPIQRSVQEPKRRSASNPRGPMKSKAGTMGVSMVNTRKSTIHKPFSLSMTNIRGEERKRRLSPLDK